MEPSQDDGLKWFGEGFDGFPKRLPEDCMEYMIYLIDSKLDSIAATRARLNDLLKNANQISKNLFKDYIWQRDPFSLKTHPSALDPQQDQNATEARKKDSGRPHLRGRTNFGDSIADEWHIVYLLLELTKKHPAIWIQVYDTDGEFLLIEAAGALQKWLKPDIAENRVWLNNGHLRIIPLQEKSPSQKITREEALRFIEQTPQDLEISPYVEDEAFHRLREYPGAISASLHNAMISIPRKLAYVLHHDPAYISPAIEAFYLRDPVAVRPLTTKDLSTLNFAPEDFVTVSVRFSKVGYAQLRSQVFNAPPAWTGVLPRLKDPKVEMGMKLTCGFEMLIADPQNQDKRAVREIKLLLNDLENGDDALPDDKTVISWPQIEDDEKWLDIDYNDFEDELSGRARQKGESGAKGNGFGDANAQENLRKMVSRFEDFMKDDEAGIDGVDDADSDDDDDDDDDNQDDDANSEPSSTGEDKEGSFDEAEFERAMKEMMGMPPDEIEKSGLLEEARRLAVEDAEAGGEMNIDEDEEVKKMMALMEKELKSHGALDLNSSGATKSSKGKKNAVTRSQKPEKTVHFGPERPPGMTVAKSTRAEDIADEELGHGDEELSSDDEEHNDIDLDLAKNMLEAFKGQAGMSGPAGNLMRQMGINLPRDEDSD